MTKRNNKGFSLIELLVVAAIVIVATAVAGGAATSAYHARSYKAAKTVDGMIAQSKVNALSGTKNCLIITFDSSSNCYKCGLHTIEYNSETGEYYDSAEAYEEQEIGNNHLHIICGEVDILSGGKIRLEFNMDTGRIKSLKTGAGGNTTVLGPGVTDTVADIDFNFYTNRTIRIYKSTGEHEFL